MYTYLSLIVSPIIPVTILFVMNIIIIRAVWKSQRMRNGNQTGQQDRNRSIEVQLTVMLILVSTLFVILLLPFEIREIYYSYVSKAETPKQYTVFLFIFDITYELYNLNYGINFFLYFVSGTKFRRDLLVLLGMKSRNVLGQPPFPQWPKTQMKKMSPINTLTFCTVHYFYIPQAIVVLTTN